MSRPAFADALARTLAPPDNPTDWVTNRLNGHLWSTQQQIATSVQNNRRTAVPSCYDSGKSYLASVLVTWWVDTHPRNTTRVVTTATTYRQVRAILWQEIARRHQQARLPGYVNQTEWWVDGQLVADGTRPADHDPAAFQGIHQKHVLVILDEAAGVPQTIWDAAEGLITNESARILAIGNPADPTSHFARICKPGTGWNVIHIDALETPNFTGEPVPPYLSDLLISTTWVEERRAQWGEQSALWISKVRGRFPEDAEDTVIPLSYIRQVQVDTHPAGLPVELGVDVGAGGDQTVIQERRGARAGRTWAMDTRDPMEVVGRTVRCIQDTQATAVKVDVIGWGWGVAGRLEELKRERVHGAKIVRVNVGEGASDREKYVNLRAQIWWEVGREQSQQRGWDLTDLGDDVVAQLIEPKWKLDSRGRIQIEPKDETKARIGRSPDQADALLLAYYSPAHKSKTIKGYR